MNGSGHRAHGPLSGLRDRVAVGLAVFVPLTALPVGSNRASLWLLFTAALAAIALLVIWRSAVVEPRWKPRFLSHRLAFALALLPLAWAAFQIAPIGAAFPFWTAGGPSISVLPSVGLSGILRLTGYILLAALVAEIASSRTRVLKVAHILFAGILLQAIWAVVALQLLGDFSLWGPKTAYQGVATGTFVNRNSLATFLGFGLILGIGLMAEHLRPRTIRETRKRSALNRFGFYGVFVTIGMGFIFIALVATQSRLGLAASVTGLLATVIVLLYVAALPVRRIIGIVMTMVVVCAGIAFFLGAGGIADRLLFTAADSVNRIALYQQTLGMIADRPLTGFGLDTFSAAFEAYRRPPLDAPVTYDLAHNTYLALWAELGVIAGSAPLLALGIAAVTLFKRLSDDQGNRALAATGIGALTLSAVHSLGDFSLEIPANAYMLTILVMMGMGLRTTAQRKGQAA